MNELIERRLSPREATVRFRSIHPGVILIPKTSRFECSIRPRFNAVRGTSRQRLPTR
jgi:hypothetical protein